MPLRPAVSLVSVHAPAKINLTLRVRGRRDDGYHLLDSLVVFADVGDMLTVKPAKDLRLTVRGPFKATLLGEPENLVMGAARLLKSAAGVKAGADILLEKNLPVASGIGGGSSDAAATLIACAKLWSADLARLSTSALAGLGADVPVCLKRRPVFMSGIGEVLSEAPPLPAAWLVLANPGVALATRDVFTALAGRFTPGDERPVLATIADAQGLADSLRPHGNDLAAPALELQPIIGEVLGALEGTPKCLLARLSGSGPTCFGLFGTEAEARQAAERMSGDHGAWWVAAAAILTADNAV